MFEKLKGIKKGNAVAEQTSKGTMNLVNYLVNEGVKLKTEDTLWICFNFYSYCMILTLEREKIFSKVVRGGSSERKANKFFERQYANFGLNFNLNKL